MKLKYSSHGRAPANPNLESASVTTISGAIVHGPKKRVIMNPVMNAPAGDVILWIILFALGRIQIGISVAKLPFL